MNRTRRRLLLATAVAAVALPTAGVAAWLLAVQAEPAVATMARPTVQDIARASALLKRHDPRYVHAGVIRAATLSARDIELLLAQAAQRLDVPPRAQVQLGTESAQLALSLPLSRWHRAMAWLPAGAAGRGGWLNLQAELRQTDRWPQLTRLRIGALPLPTALASWALPHAVRAMGLQAPQDLALDLVNRVTLTRTQVVVAFTWPADLQQRMARSLLPPAEQDRLRAYAQHLDGVTRQLRLDAGQGGRVPLPLLLQPMFELAAQRSSHSGQPARENRAALLTLAAWVVGGPVKSLVPVMGTQRLPAPLPVTLAGRTDTPQHYLVSAALAMEGGGPLSDAIGLYKESLDAHGGSGFSFNDLAADRAGTRLGLRAVRDPQATQSRLAAGVQESDLLPLVSDLPEGLGEVELRRRYGGVDGPLYRRLVDDIEARLERLPLLRAMP